jgi:hypothetical protein
MVIQQLEQIKHSLNGLRLSSLIAEKGAISSSRLQRRFFLREL